MSTSNREMMNISRARIKNIEKLVSMVKGGTLNFEEAAQSQAGWDLKNFPPAIRRVKHKGIEQANLLGRAKIEISTRLPQFDGISKSWL